MAHGSAEQGDHLLDHMVAADQQPSASIRVGRWRLPRCQASRASAVAPSRADLGQRLVRRLDRHHPPVLQRQPVAIGQHARLGQVDQHGLAFGRLDHLPAQPAARRNSAGPRRKAPARLRTLRARHGRRPGAAGRSCPPRRARHRPRQRRARPDPREIGATGPSGGGGIFAASAQPAQWPSSRSGTEKSSPAT
jgi:hypothetical protein